MCFVSMMGRAAERVKAEERTPKASGFSGFDAKGLVWADCGLARS